MDEALSRAGDDGVPLLVSDPEAPASTEIRKVAEALPVVRSSLVGKSLPLFVG